MATTKKNLIYTLAATLIVALGSLAATILTSTSPLLGLDLEGGLSVIYAPVGEYPDDVLDLTTDLYRERVDAYGIAEPEVYREGDNIVVNIPGLGKDESARAASLIGTTGKVTLRPTVSVSTQITPDCSTEAAPIIAPTDPTVVTVPGSTVAPESTVATESTVAPSTAAPTSAAGAARAPRSATTEPATPSTSAAPSTSTTSSTTVAPTTLVSTDGTSVSTTPGSVSTDTTVPLTLPETLPSVTFTPPEGDLPEVPVVLPGDRDPESGFCFSAYNLGPAFALGEDALDSATAEFNGDSWQVSLNLKGGDKGFDAWNQWAAICNANSAGCEQGGMAIVLDHEVISAPVPQEPFFSTPNISITGSFTRERAENLAQILSYGATPVETKQLSSDELTPTLGDKALKAAIISGIVGIALVLILMLLYYRTLALVVVGGLVVSGSLIWSIISVLSHQQGLRLSLAGLTGIIVSVGVTVDSYVVFFERLKDEVRAGKSLRSSAARGYKAALRTIVAADLVSLLGAGVLYWLSVGSVRGFAFYLGLSTLIDLVVSFFFTRPVILLLARSDRFHNKGVLGIRSGEAYAGGVA